MAKELSVEYDEVGDILYLDIAPPDEHQIMEEVAPGALLRRNTVTGRIDGIELRDVKRRSSGGRSIAVPLEIMIDRLGSIAG